MDISIIYACLAMIGLTFCVGITMLVSRINEMKTKRVSPQSTSTSVQMATKLVNIQAADNYRNLFEAPVIFYALIAVSLSVSHVPDWLVVGLWTFVLLRYLHSLIHCTYNKVMHRAFVFALSSVLIVSLWIGFVATM